MLPIPSFLAPASVCARILNQLLRREGWARERLSRYSGKTVRFVAGHTTLALTLQSSGYTEPSDSAIVPDVTLTIPTQKLGRLPGILRSGDSSEIAALMHVEGDAGLAHVVSDLARELRWDIEDDLAKVVGDVAAVRLIHGVKSLASGAQVSAERLAGSVSEYLSEESQLVLGRPVYEEWRTQLSTVQSRLDSLDQRISRLTRKIGQTPANRA